MGIAGNITFIGMTVVFIALIALAVLISILSLISGQKRKRNKGLAEDAGNGTQRDTVKTCISGVDLLETKAGVHGIAVNKDNDLAAVLASAVYAFYENNGSNCGISIKPYRRMLSANPDIPAWNMAGRLERLSSVKR